MGKTYRNDPLDQYNEDEDNKLMELYDKLASQWAKKQEARRNKARA